MSIPPHISDQAKSILEFAHKHSASGLETLMLSSRVAMPSVEELKAELGGDLFEQYMRTVVVHCADDATT